jgi:hypothetical protein
METDFVKAAATHHSRRISTTASGGYPPQQGGGIKTLNHIILNESSIYFNVWYLSFILLYKYFSKGFNHYFLNLDILQY